MTRLEENKIVIDEMLKRSKLKPSGTYEEMVVFNLGTIATMLTDISKSLAIIADKAEKGGEWIDDKCSSCGKGIEDLIDSREWYRNEKPNFCPFCGLKLVDSQESEE